MTPSAKHARRPRARARARAPFFAHDAQGLQSLPQAVRGGSAVANIGARVEGAWEKRARDFDESRDLDAYF
jgi:hypothetical protein